MNSLKLEQSDPQSAWLRRHRVNSLIEGHALPAIRSRFRNNRWGTKEGVRDQLTFMAYLTLGLLGDARHLESEGIVGWIDEQRRNNPDGEVALTPVGEQRRAYEFREVLAAFAWAAGCSAWEWDRRPSDAPASQDDEMVLGSWAKNYIYPEANDRCRYEGQREDDEQPVQFASILTPCMLANTSSPNANLLFNHVAVERQRTRELYLAIQDDAARRRVEKAAVEEAVEKAWTSTFGPAEA